MGSSKMFRTLYHHNDRILQTFVLGQPSGTVKVWVPYKEKTNIPLSDLYGLDKDGFDIQETKTGMYIRNKETYIEEEDIKKSLVIQRQPVTTRTDSSKAYKTMLRLLMTGDLKRLMWMDAKNGIFRRFALETATAIATRFTDVSDSTPLGVQEFIRSTPEIKSVVQMLSRSDAFGNVADTLGTYISNIGVSKSYVRRVNTVANVVNNMEGQGESGEQFAAVFGMFINSTLVSATERNEVVVRDLMMWPRRDRRFEYQPAGYRRNKSPMQYVVSGGVDPDILSLKEFDDWTMINMELYPPGTFEGFPNTFEFGRRTATSVDHVNINQAILESPDLGGLYKYKNRNTDIDTKDIDTVVLDRLTSLAGGDMPSVRFPVKKIVQYLTELAEFYGWNGPGHIMPYEMSLPGPNYEVTLVGTPTGADVRTYFDKTHKRINNKSTLLKEFSIYGRMYQGRPVPVIKKHSLTVNSARLRLYKQTGNLYPGYKGSI